jgi:hypothetical protein
MLVKNTCTARKRDKKCGKTVEVKCGENGEENGSGERKHAAVVKNKRHRDAQYKKHNEHQGADGKNKTAEAGESLTALELDIKGVVMSEDGSTACHESRKQKLVKDKLGELDREERLHNIEKHNEHAPKRTEVHKGIACSEISRSVFADIYSFNFT